VSCPRRPVARRHEGKAAAAFQELEVCVECKRRGNGSSAICWCCWAKEGRKRVGAGARHGGSGVAAGRSSSGRGTRGRGQQGRGAGPGKGVSDPGPRDWVHDVV
jgi:hypothetical protein